MHKVYIVDAVRTPIGKFGRSLISFPPQELGAMVIKWLIERNGVDSDWPDFVVMGQVIRDGFGMDTARQAAIKAGLSHEIDAMTVDMVCASGMAAIITAYNMIKAGEADLVIAGGMESMSRSPFLIPWEYRWGVKLLYGSQTPIIDSLVFEGLTDPFNGLIMAQEADKLAKELRVGRDQLEEVALNSHRRAYEATEKGYFKREYREIRVGDRVVLDRDEGIRGDTTLERMAKLPTIFPGGVHTPATASQISDGAAALLLASEEAIDRYGLGRRAEIIGYSVAGVETWRFPLAPIKAVEKLLSRLNMDISEVDYFENNEAFAISNIVFEDMLGVDRDRLNVFGGAIALGHPLGASGARITTTLLNILETHGANIGLASICHGMGGATALMIRRKA